MTGCPITISKFSQNSLRYGRRAVLVVVLFGIAVADTACAMAPNFWFLILSRFFQGVFLNVKSARFLTKLWNTGHVHSQFYSLYGIAYWSKPISGYLLFWWEKSDHVTNRWIIRCRVVLDLWILYHCSYSFIDRFMEMDPWSKCYSCTHLCPDSINV